MRPLLPTIFIMGWVIGTPTISYFELQDSKMGNVLPLAMVTLYFNGIKAHTNQTINQVWGGPNSGIDGGNEGGKGITDIPGGLKLQAEGHEVLYGNIWIRRPNTDF